MRQANEYERADHDRDLRKHDTLPHRFDRRISTSMDIAILVRALGNLEDAAALIDQFVDTKASEQRLDAVAAGARP
jgi:hypothetical protein